MVYQKRYTWNNVNRSVPADVVGRTLERLEAENGYVDRKLFLDASRPEDSATHALFEWDDAVAAERYRLGQSRNIINDLAVVVVECEKDDVQYSIAIEPNVAEEIAGQQLAAYVNCGDSRQSKVRYTNTLRAMSSVEGRLNVLRHAIAELRMFQRKYNAYSELSGVFAEIDLLSIKGA